MCSGAISLWQGCFVIEFPRVWAVDANHTSVCQGSCMLPTDQRLCSYSLQDTLVTSSLGDRVSRAHCWLVLSFWSGCALVWTSHQAGGRADAGVLYPSGPASKLVCRPENSWCYVASIMTGLIHLRANGSLRKAVEREGESTAATCLRAMRLCTLVENRFHLDNNKSPRVHCCTSWEIGGEDDLAARRRTNQYS